MPEDDLPEAARPLLARLAAQQLGCDDAARILKCLLAMGCRIDWPSAQPDHDAHKLAERGECALQEGKPFEALEVANQGLRHWPDHVRLRQIQALATARTGACEQANRILAELAAQEHQDAETLGMLARTHKDFGFATDDPAERNRHFRQARQLYADAYRRTGGYWTGINAATLTTLLGETGKAAELARSVRDQCLREWEAGGADPYWLPATLAEAELNQGNWTDAER